MSDAGFESPALTQKELLLRVEGKVDNLDAKVDEMKVSLIVLVSHQLAPRVAAIEAFKERMVGLSYSAILLGVIGTIASMVALFFRGA